MKGGVGRHLLLGILALWVCACQVESEEQSSRQISKTIEEPCFSPIQMKEDIHLLWKELETYHPGLYQYTSKEELKQAFQEVQRRIQKETSLLEFYKLLSPVIALIRCGHTSLRLPKVFSSVFFEQPRLLPFHLKFIQNNVVIFGNKSKDSTLVAGTRILQINGKPVKQLIRKMMKSIATLSDGKNITGKYRYIEQHFSVLYSIFISAEDFTYTIDCQLPHTNKIQKKQVVGVSLPVLQAKTDRKKEFPLHLNIIGKTAILSIQTFDRENFRQAGINYPLFLKKVFREIHQKKSKLLILDLRNNRGGDDSNVMLLLSYLIPQRFKCYEQIEVTPFYQGYGQVRRNERGKYLITHHKGLYLQDTSSQQFLGKLYVLMNGATFSGAADATAVLHSYHRGTFVGEETGGGYRGNTSGIMPLYTLKNSQIGLRIPRWKYTLVVKDSSVSTGTQPDYLVRPTLEDFNQKVDTEMRFVFDLIKENP